MVLEKRFGKNRFRAISLWIVDYFAKNEFRENYCLAWPATASAAFFAASGSPR